MLVRASDASARACSRNATRLRMTSASRSKRIAHRAAGFALQRQRGGEEAIFRQMVAIGECVQSLVQRHAESDLIGDLSETPAGRIRAVSATLRMPPVIGMPTRTARTSIASASGNCSNRIRSRRCSHQR